MSTTFVFPEHFEVQSPTGNLLEMTRLYRFRHYTYNSLEPDDYVAAMETKHAPFLNHPELIDVFRIDSGTGAPLYVSLDEENIYAAARSLYDNYQSAGFFIDRYRKRLCEKYDPYKILPYMEELEIKILNQPEPRAIALSLLSQFNEKQKVLRELHKAMCAIDKRDDFRLAADKQIFTLWAHTDGLAIGTNQLGIVSTKNSLLNALYELLLLDAGNDPDTQSKARAFILDTYWAKPRCIEEVYHAVKEHFDKAPRIKRLQELQGMVRGDCSVSKEDIQNLWFSTSWKFFSRRYYDAICNCLNGR